MKQSDDGELKHFEHGLQLYELRRYDLAVREFQAALSEQPDNGRCMAYLALSLSETNELKQASKMAEGAVACAPDVAFVHYAQAHVARKRKAGRASLEAIKRALAIEPGDTHYLGFAALLAADKRNYTEALRLATAGLAIDPVNSMCMNIRAMALIRMGETVPAKEALLEELRRHPQDSLTLANLGWLELRTGKRQEALDLFSRSLAEDPEDDYARSGLMEAVRSRYPVYGLVLRYFTWVGDMSEQGQYALMGISYAAQKVMDELARQYPKLRPWIKLGRQLLGYFMYLTWVARPIANLLLRTNAYGRRLLNADEYNESNLVGLSLVGAAGCWIMRSWLHGPLFWILANAVFMTIVIPISCVFRARIGWRRTIASVYTSALFGIGMAGVYYFWVSALSGPAQTLFSVYGMGLLACQYLVILLNNIPERD